MTSSPTAGALLGRLATAVAGHDWPGLRALLADDATVRYLHTGEAFDADGWVAFNRDYPGDWEFAADERVDAGDRGVLLTDLVELWTEAVAAHPERGTA